MPYYTAIKKYIFAHTYISAVVLVAVLGAGYWEYGRLTSTPGQTLYVLGTVVKKTVISSVSGSGQVTSSSEADIKSKASGDVIALHAKTGQRVSQGQALLVLDNAAAQSAVTDAQLAVEQAKINLEHDTLQAPIDYKDLQDALDRATRDLATQYSDTYGSLSDAFIKLPDIITGTNSILYDKTIDPTVQNIAAYENIFVSFDSDRQTIHGYAVRSDADYAAARDAYTKSAALFKALSRTSTPTDIASALNDAQSTAALLAKAAVSETNLIDTTVDLLQLKSWTISTKITTAQTNSRAYVSSANSVLSSLTSAKKSLDNAADAVTSAQHAFDLASVGNPAGDNPFTLKISQNTLKQKEAALADALQALADHTVRAPFSGILATFTPQRGDSLSSGTTVGTLISDQTMAELSLNEIDATKVHVGDKATLTLDAIENLTLTGKVAEIDPIGTVSQGVVSYSLKISFDTLDARVKPGMTVNASIQTAIRQDVLTVPSSAVKTSNGQSTVQRFNPPLVDASGGAGVASATPPEIVPVTVGISDDTNVEVLSGLTEGEQVVVRTTSSAVKTTAASATTRTGSGGGLGGAGIRL